MQTQKVIRGAIAVVLALAGLAAILFAVNQPSRAQAFRPAAPLQEDIVVTTTIQAAIDAAQPGDTVIIPPGLYTESLTLDKPINLTGSDMISTVIRAVTGQRVMTVSGAVINSSVIISGLKLIGGDLTAGATCPSYCGGGVLILNGAQPTFQNVTFSSNNARTGGAIYVASGGAQLIDVDISSNRALDRGGGLYLVTGTLTLSGGQIWSNRADNSGGGLFIAEGSAEMDSGTILSNTAGSHGGGVYLATPGASFKQMGGNVERNEAIHGGGLFMSAGNATLSGGQMLNNVATSDGGGVMVVTGTLSLEGGRILSNTAWSDGGGVYVSSTIAALSLSSGAIENNRANDSGGGVKVRDGKFIMSGGQIADNVANYDGGGVLLFNPTATFTQTGGIIQHNRAGSNGGGLFINSGHAMLMDGLIYSNTAFLNGGGVFVHNAEAVFTQTQGTLALNATQFGGGGGLYVDTGSAALFGGHIVSNTSGGDGGGAYVLFGELRANGPVRFVGNSTVGNGGGVYAETALMITGTQFLGNQATAEGGGVYLLGTGGGRIINTVLARNQSGQYNSNMTLNSTGAVQVLHITVADVNWRNGSGVTVLSGTVSIVNSIVASHSVGIRNVGGIVLEDGNLFYGNTLAYTGTINHGGFGSLTGNPAFINPAVDNYHITRWSAALNAANSAGVFTDMDGQPRPVGPGFDIGADEAQIIWAIIVSPTLSHTLIYTNARGTVWQLQIPPGAVTDTATILFGLVETTTVPTSLLGYDFGTDAFEMEALPTFTSTVPLSLTQGVTLTIHYADADIAGLGERTLTLYRAVGNAWEKVGTQSGEVQSLEMTNNMLTAYLTGFSRFGMMGFIRNYDIFLPLVLK